MADKMGSPELIGGPYSMPAASIGDTLRCEVRGDMVVTGITAAPIPWLIGRPSVGRGRSSLIVRGDLSAALRLESRSAVCHWFGVSSTVAGRWRRALGVERVTPGTSALLADRPPPAPSEEEARERGRKGARKRWGESD